MKLNKTILNSIIIVLLAFTVIYPVIVNAATVKSSINYTKTLEYKSYKDISLRYISVNTLKKKALKLSLEDKEIIKKYVFGAVKGEDTFLLINSHLRGTLKEYIPAKEITKPLGYRLDYYADNLQKSLAKTKLQQNITLYAAIDDREIQHLFKNYNIDYFLKKKADNSSAEEVNKKIKGMKFTEKGFLSASYDKNCIDKTWFRVEIKAPKNMQAVLIEEFGEKTKKRVIINRNYKWEVMAVNYEHDKENKSDYYNIIIRNIK
jgi:hypothetical protein